MDQHFKFDNLRTLLQQTVTTFENTYIPPISIASSPTFCEESDGVVPEILRISDFEIYYF